MPILIILSDLENRREYYAELVWPPLSSWEPFSAKYILNLCECEIFSSFLINWIQKIFAILEFPLNRFERISPSVVACFVSL